MRHHRQCREASSSVSGERRRRTHVSEELADRVTLVALELEDLSHLFIFDHSCERAREQRACQSRGINKKELCSLLLLPLLLPLQLCRMSAAIFFITPGARRFELSAKARTAVAALLLLERLEDLL